MPFVRHQYDYFRRHRGKERGLENAELDWGKHSAGQLSMPRTDLQREMR